MRGYLATTVLAVTLLLAGCDNESPPATAKAPPAAASAPEAPKSSMATGPQGSAADLRAYRLDPLPTRAFVLPAPPPKKQDLARNSQLKKPAVPKPAPALIHPLDLSVPGEAAASPSVSARRLGSGKADNNVAEAGLLPQLFRKEGDPGRFELGGRVISRDRSDDFEGAEVELRFRR